MARHSTSTETLIRSRAANPTFSRSRRAPARFSIIGSRSRSRCSVATEAGVAHHALEIAEALSERTHERSSPSRETEALVHGCLIEHEDRDGVDRDDARRTRLIED